MDEIDEGTIKELLHQYGEKLIDIATPIVGSEDLAQDVVQEVFFNLWDTRAQLNIQGSLKAYLYRAVRNRALNVRKREHSRWTIEDNVHASYENKEPSVPHSGEISLLNADLDAAVQKALASLSPKLREVFLLKHQHDLSYPEIAEALGVAVASVHQQMYRATRELAQKLGLKADLEG